MVRVRLAIVAAALAALATWLPLRAGADVVSDEAAAILIFPRILAERATLRGRTELVPTFDTVDTVVQISNTSTTPANLRCFYVSANGHCSVTGSACLPNDSEDFSCPDDADVCLPGWAETDFQVVLTPRQPLAWRATVGMSRDQVPLDGVVLRGPGGESNAGTLIPPLRLEAVAYVPPMSSEIRIRSFFAGELKCVVVDDSGRGIPRNVVKGEATVIKQREFDIGFIDSATPRVEKYNAMGIKAIQGDANGDGVLELGGDANEYNGCSTTLIAEHLFDFASYGVGPQVSSEFTLVPCTQDLRAQIPGSTTAQFLVFNEFEQRLSTSARVDCYFKRPITRIDTRNRSRSIFSVGVAGTFAAQTRIRGVDTGLLGVISESVAPWDATFSADASFQFGLQGTRPTADRIALP